MRVSQSCQDRDGGVGRGPLERQAVDETAHIAMLRSMTDAKASTARLSTLLRRVPPRQAVEWAVRAVSGNGHVLSIESLRGGSSHANHALRIDAGRAIHEVVLRRWVRSHWQETDPESSPAQEASTYDLLAWSAVPAPRLLAADVAGRECDVPAILITRAPGTRPSRPREMGSFLAQLAGALPPIHAIDPGLASRTLPPYRPYYDRARLHVPAWTQAPSIWERAIEAAAGPEPKGPAACIHRDYHPGNTLWADEQLTAIVDWTTASWGPPEVDLAHMRVNLAMSFGVETADAFLDAYRAAVGRPYALDPYWDLRDAVDFVPELPANARSIAKLRRLDEFVARAVARL